MTTFQGRRRVDIRKYYSKDGEPAPTKKGISLNARQWKAVLAKAGEIEEHLG